MKKIRSFQRYIYLFTVLMLLSIPGILFSQKLPKPVGYVNDFANVIDSQSKQEMSQLIGVINKKAGVEIAVVTVQTIAPYGSIEQYAIDLASQWGIGKKEKDNGLLILLAMKERKIRIDVGYGLEGIITDGLSGQIIDQSILPSLKTGQYGIGLLKGVQAVSGIIAKEYHVDLRNYNLNVDESKRYTRTGGFPMGLISFIILIFLFGGGRFLLWPLLLMGGFGGRGFFGGGFGAGGNSGFGGGFSGFGGGGFGGGGASRGF